MISETQNNFIGNISPMSNKRSEIFLSISERLREERNRIKKTQEEIALSLGLTARTWGTYERGQSMPDAWVLSELEKKGIDIYYVITGNKLPVGLGNDEEEKIIKQYRNAEESVKFAINNIFDALKL